MTEKGGIGAKAAQAYRALSRVTNISWAPPIRLAAPPCHPQSRRLIDPAIPNRSHQEVLYEPAAGDDLLKVVGKGEA